jgi:alkanesulfonate monooxygenase SsuD/methylene tetrahydromethanopterin reductase-like flavin-dependent oxidoreductase (luciferase family)
VPAIRLGLLCWNQNTDWPSLREAGVRADRLGYDSLWAWDHLYPIVGDPHGPFYEGWLTITAWAAATDKIRVGLMVGANPYRNPALVAKMASTLDRINGGRTYLGIGAAWNETEAGDFGMEMGDGPPERLRWLGEALPIIRGMLGGEEPTAAGSHYHARHVRNDPAPVQPRLPILIGGGGEKVTLKLVAKFADANNLGGGFETVKRKEEILLRHCEAAGRDEREIERTAGVGVVVIRDSHAEAERVFRRLFEVNRVGRLWEDQPVGTPEEVAEKLAPYLDIGYRHLIVGHPAPYDEESAVRLANEVRPKLESVG